MSLDTDYLTKGLQEHAENDFEGESYEDMLWRQKNGKTILINKMTFSHLQNTVKMLERNEATDIPQYHRLQQEIERIKPRIQALFDYTDDEILAEVRRRCER